MAIRPREQFEAAVRGYRSAVDVDRNLFLFVNAGRQETNELRRLVDRSATLMIDLFSAASGLQTPTTARTWAYSILGAFQVVTVMWLGSGYSDRNTVAADLIALLCPASNSLPAPVDRPPREPSPALTDPTRSTRLTRPLGHPPARRPRRLRTTRREFGSMRALSTAMTALVHSTVLGPPTVAPPATPSAQPSLMARRPVVDRSASFSWRHADIRD